MKMQKGTRVTIYSPHPKSQFDGRKGVIAFRSDIAGRWFVHLEGDPKGMDVEFLREELLFSGQKNP